MKVGVYLNTKSDDDNEGDMFYHSLKNHPKVDTLKKLNLSKLEMTVSQGDAVFKFDDTIVNKENFDLIVVRGGHKDIHTSMQLVKYCQHKGIKIFDNNLHKVRYFINKKVDIVNFSMVDIPIPKTYIFSSFDQIHSAGLNFPLIMKGINSSQGKKIFKVNSESDVESILTDKGGSLGDYLLQEIIDYEYDIRLIIAGEKVIGSMRRIPQEGEFRANFSLGGFVEKYEATDDMKEVAIKAARSCDLLISGVDILVDRTGKYYVIEANRTPGLAGISKAMNMNIGDKLVDFIFEYTGVTTS